MCDAHDDWACRHRECNMASPYVPFHCKSHGNLISEWKWNSWEVSIAPWYSKHAVHLLLDMCVCGEAIPLPPEEVRLPSQKKTPAKSVKDPGEDVSARWYLITLTQPDTITCPLQILKNTQKVLKSKMVSPIAWCYSLELTKKGTPHTHIALCTSKYLEYNKIKAFNAPWIMDIVLEKTNVRNYVIKEESKPSAAWLATYGLDVCVWSSDNWMVKPSLELVEDDVPRNIISHP